MTTPSAQLWSHAVFNLTRVSGSKGWLTIRDISLLTGLDNAVIRAAIKNGGLPALRSGRHAQWSIKSVDALKWCAGIGDDRFRDSRPPLSPPATVSQAN